MPELGGISTCALDGERLQLSVKSEPDLAVSGPAEGWPYAQVTGADPDSLVSTRQLKDALAAEEHRCLARQVCWAFHGPAAEACTRSP